MPDKRWCADFLSTEKAQKLRDNPIAYFCAEYALSDDLPLYAGGLGVLAGDIVREASERDFPLVAIGLLYHEGYMSHDLYKEGIMMKDAETVNPADTMLEAVNDEHNNRIIVHIPVHDKQIYMQAWRLNLGSVTVYLLDTRISQNEEDDRQITDHLYASSREMRFKQEMVLAIGGFRLLQALGIRPSGYHLNEGHSALLPLEIARHLSSQSGKTFHDELNAMKEQIFFTNHTLVNAGNDTYNTDLVATLLEGFVRELKVPVNEIIALGSIAGSNIFSLTLLALRTAGKINAVSALHAQKAKDIWPDHPMIPITNGIHIKSWDKIYTEQDMWVNHLRNKRELLGYIYQVTGTEWSEHDLLLGWARRIVGYKRPLALFDNLEQYKKIAMSADRPVRIVISGLSHESDTEGLAILERIQQVVTHDLKGYVTYIPRHRVNSAKYLVAGCDVWLNTPIVGFEACGTSGMKAALNGVLPCTTNDGWVAESNLLDIGWLLESEHLSFDILGILENQIAPLYYTRNDAGVPDQWVRMMCNARQMVVNQFSATTMLRKYTEQFYCTNLSGT